MTIVSGHAGRVLYITGSRVDVEKLSMFVLIIYRYKHFIPLLRTRVP